MLKKSENHNPNYLAKVVKLENPVKHPNADRLQGWTIDGGIVWTDMSRKEGDLCVFFPIECAISSKLLHGLNMYSSADMNANPEIKGYIGNQSRVKALRLRGEPSQGLLIALVEVTNILGSLDSEIPPNIVGTEFDVWGNETICQKYVPRGGTPAGNRERVSRHDKKLKKISRLIPGQFHFHADTLNLRRNAHKVGPDDIVSITYKLHGTSFIVGNIEVKRKQNWLERTLSKWGWIKGQPREYDIVYSSRGVIKNQYAINKTANHYYGYDLWADIKDVLAPDIEKGITLYGECVGFDRTGKMIQKGYDYSYRPANNSKYPFKVQQPGFFAAEYEEGIQFGVYIYKITQTNEDGVVHRFTWQQVKDYCNKHGIKYVPEIYYGKAAIWAPGLDPNEHWNESFITALQDAYLEKDCHMCSTKIPGEGVVVAIDGLYEESAFKLKSFRFLERESKELDTAEIDIETEQTQTI